MTTKQVKGVIVPRHDTAINWSKAINFTPKKGELIVYDADTDNYNEIKIIGTTQCTIKSSDKVRFKFGDGVSNVNILPFTTTENSGGSGEGGFTEEEIIEIVKKYSENEAGAIVYLNTKQEIGKNIELQDVYPIQACDTLLKLTSKNNFIYNETTQTISGITIKSNSNDGVKVSGSATATIPAKYIEIGAAKLDTPGRYTLSATNYGVDTTDKQCYIVYNLIDENNSIIREYSALNNGPITIDSTELNCTLIKFYLYLNVNSGASFNTAASQTFKIQTEYGENATPYTKNADMSNLFGKGINIYCRNLYKEGFPSSLIKNASVKFNGELIENATNIGMHHIKGVMQSDYVISIANGDNESTIDTPLYKGDKFTLIYNVVGDTTPNVDINNIQLVYGHTDYETYAPCKSELILCDSDGVFDISKLKYPYSFLTLANPIDDEGYAIYLSYDPALSRNWTEKQLSDLNKRIDTLESIIKSLTN